MMHGESRAGKAPETWMMEDRPSETHSYRTKKNQNKEKLEEDDMCVSVCVYAKERERDRRDRTFTVHIDGKGLI